MPATLAELLIAFELFAVCTSCRRTEQLDLKHLVENMGKDCAIETIRQRVRCTSCLRRTGDIRIVYVGRCGSARGFHYRLR